MLEVYMKINLFIVVFFSIASVGACFNVLEAKKGCDFIQFFQKKMNKQAPTINVSFEKDGSAKSFNLTSSFLRKTPIFSTYNSEFFEKNLINGGSFECQSEDENIPNKELSNLLEEVIQEIKSGIRKFTHFDILTAATFNWDLRAGALVLKFKDYPFVAKLFIENPYSMTHPFSKGFEDYALFRMGGGISRHLAGFTRIANRENISKKIEALNVTNFLSLPRKWFWKSEEEGNLLIRGYNFPGQKDIMETVIPSVYAVVADAINAERSFSLCNKQDRTIAFTLFNDLDNCIDPNPNNFMIEKNTGDLFLIDTEHWPSLIGVTKKPQVSNYCSYYLLFGAIHCIQNFIFGMQNQEGKSFDCY